MIFTIPVKAQIQFFDRYFVFTQKDFYNLNEGISLATIKDGDYKRAKYFLESDDMKANPETAFYINALLTYNTKGKDAALEMLEKSGFPAEKKDFLKLWLAYFADYREDYFNLLSEFEKKNSQSSDFLKFKTYLEIRENAKAIGTSTRFRDDFYRRMNIAIKNSKTAEDKMFFRLAKLDIKSFEEDYKEAKNARIDSLYTLWKENKNLFSYRGIEKTILSCESAKCLEMNSWISTEQKKYERNIYTPEEEIVSKLIIQGKEDSDKKMALNELENFLDSFLQKSNSAKKEDFKAVLSIYFLQKQPKVGVMMEGLFNPIPFSPGFRTKYELTMSKDQIIARMKQMSEEPEYENSFREGMAGKFKEEIDHLKVYGIDDLRVMYGLLVFSNYYGPLLKKSFEKTGMTLNRPTEKQLTNSKELLKYYDENPLYYNESPFFDYDVKDINTYADLQNFLSSADLLIKKYQGSKSVRIMMLQIMGKKKNLIPKDQYQDYLSLYFKNLVDMYDEIQSVYFHPNDTVTMSNIVLEGDQRYNYPICNDFLKLFTKENLEKNYKFLLKKTEAKPYQKNLRSFLESFNEFKTNQ